MWINRSLKVPDEGQWLALVVIDSDGANDILGYIDLVKWQKFVNTANDLNAMMLDWFNQEVKYTK